MVWVCPGAHQVAKVRARAVAPLLVALRTMVPAAAELLEHSENAAPKCGRAQHQILIDGLHKEVGPLCRPVDASQQHAVVNATQAGAYMQHATRRQDCYIYARYRAIKNNASFTAQ